MLMQASTILLFLFAIIFQSCIPRATTIMLLLISMVMAAQCAKNEEIKELEKNEKIKRYKSKKQSMKQDNYDYTSYSTDWH